MTKNRVTGVIAATILLVLPAAVGVAEDAKKPQATAETAGVTPGKRFVGFERGMGIGGWLTNYKRFNVEYRENWMRDVIALLKENGIPYSVWNYLSTPNDGNRFSLVDDDTRAILSPRLLRIIQGLE